MEQFVSDWLPVVSSEWGYGLSPNPESPNFPNMPKAEEGYTYFWKPGTSPRGIKRVEVITWKDWIRSVLDDAIRREHDIVVLLRVMSCFTNNSTYPDIFDQIVRGVSKEYCYDVARFHKFPNPV